MVRSFCLVLSFMLWTLSSLQSQSYQWAAGLKLSKYMGMSVVYSPMVPYSAELIISKNFWTQEAGLSVVGRYHRKIITKGFNMFGGGGLHYGFNEGEEKDGFVALMINGGMELSMGKTNIAFNLTPMVGIDRFRIGSDLSVRYILKKQPKKKGEFWEKLGFKKKTQPPKKETIWEKLNLDKSEKKK